MMHKFNIEFISDITCPFCYLAQGRLETALESIRSRSYPIEISILFRPYILNASLKATVPLLTYLQSHKNSHSATSPDGRQKYMYLYLMSMYFSQDGTSPFNFSDLSQIGPSFDCHRLIQFLQESDICKNKYKVDSLQTEKMVYTLYKNHYCTPSNPYPPSAPENLKNAMKHAEISEDVQELFLKDPNLWQNETNEAVRLQVSNGIDSIPRVIIEGRRRDITLIGLKKVEEYVKALETIIKESF